jgi:hypothetical protein
VASWSAACRTGSWCRSLGRFRVGFGVGRLGELFCKALLFGAGGVKVNRWQADPERGTRSIL